MLPSRLGLSSEQVYSALAEEVGRDPDLVGLLDNPRLERLVEVLCQAIGGVMEANNEAIRTSMQSVVVELEARVRRL